MRRKKGFSYVEIIVYLFIVALLSVSLYFGVTYLKPGESYRKRIFCSEMIESLQITRNKALCNMQPSSLIVKSGDEIKGFRFMGDFVVSYNSAGIITKGTGTQLSSQGKTYVLTVEPVTGKLNLREV